MDRYREAAKTWAALEEMKDEEMAEARAKFKEEHPDYKSAFKPIRIKKEEFPEVPREPKGTAGLTQSELFAKLRAEFPKVTVHTHSEDPIEDVVAAIPADCPLEVLVEPEDYLPMVKFLKENSDFDMDYLIDITAIDYDDHFDMVTMLRSIGKGHKLFLSVQLKKDFSISEEKRPTALLATIDSISSLYPGAEIKEREVYDMFGINFKGHPDQRRIFLDKDFASSAKPTPKNFSSTWVRSTRVRTVHCALRSAWTARPSWNSCRISATSTAAWKSRRNR